MNFNELIVGHILANVLGIEPEKVLGFKKLSGGLTNSSYLCETAEGKFVFRAPGKDTDKIINREHEKKSLELAKELGIDPTYVCMNSYHGWKISKYEKNCYMPDYHNFEDSKLIIKKLKDLHNKKAHVD